MKVNVIKVSSATERANRVSMSFISNNATINGQAFSLYAPKSLELNVGECELPAWYADNMFERNRQYIVDGIMRSNHKDKRSKAFYSAVETAVAAVEAAYKAAPVAQAAAPVAQGGFIGQKGEAFTMLPLKVERCVYSKTGTSDFWTHGTHYYGGTSFSCWEHPTYCIELWRLTDRNGNIVMLRTSNMGIQNTLAKHEGQELVASGKIESQNEFRGVKQTFIASRGLKLEELK